MAITFTFLGDRYKTIIDREFANKYYIEDEDVFDLETNHKEELFFELQPIPYSLFMNSTVPLKYVSSSFKSLK